MADTPNGGTPLGSLNLLLALENNADQALDALRQEREKGVAKVLALSLEIARLEAAKLVSGTTPQEVKG